VTESLHRVQFDWRDGGRFEIEARETKATATELQVRQLPGCTVQIAAGEFADVQVPALGLVEDPSGFFEPLRLRENAEYLIRITVPHSIDDSKRLWEVSGSGTAWPFDSSRTGRKVRVMPPRYWTSPDGNDARSTQLLASANFGSFVGVVDLSVEGRVLRAEVASSKISYFDDFKVLLTEVSEDLTDLLFEVDSVSGYRFSLGEPGDAPPSTALFHLRRILSESELPTAFETVARHPYTKLVHTDVMVDPASATSILPDRFATAATHMPFTAGGPLKGLFRGYSPIAVVDTYRSDSVDTPENRYCKAVLEDVAALLDRLEPMLRKEKKHSSLRELHAWQERLAELASEPIWRDVGQLNHIPFNSQVLLRRDAYRQIAQADLLLQYGLVLPWDRANELADESGDIRPIYELYEYWCFFCLRRILRALCGPEKQRTGSFYTEQDGKLAVSLRRGRASQLDFLVNSTATCLSVSLFFNKGFTKPGDDQEYGDASYSTSFRPDVSILVRGRGLTHWLHFDAKYRLDVQKWEAEVDSDEIEAVEDELLGEPSERELYKKADLYKMHAYRDAIFGSRGAYALFPGQSASEQLFRRSRKASYRKDYDVPSVGAFPLRPGAAETQERVISDFLAKVFASVARGGSYEEETGFVPVP